MSNQIKTFVSFNGKEIVLTGRVPREQFKQVLTLRKTSALRERLSKLSPERVLAFRYDVQRMLAEQVKIECFETIKAKSQRGAAALYRFALLNAVRVASSVLVAEATNEGEAEVWLPAVDTEPNYTYDDLCNRDGDAAFAALLEARR